MILLCKVTGASCVAFRALLESQLFVISSLSGENYVMFEDETLSLTSWQHLFDVWLSESEK